MGRHSLLLTKAIDTEKKDGKGEKKKLLCLAVIVHLWIPHCWPDEADPAAAKTLGLLVVYSAGLNVFILMDKKQN